MRATLNGYVVGDDVQWLYDYFQIPAISPRKVRQLIADNPAGEDLVLEVNSPGGSVFAGFEAYSVIRSAKCRTVAEIQSIAASAASTIVSGCDTVLMSPVGQLMLHLPATYTEGDREDHKQSIKVLDTIAASIVNGYLAKCKNKSTREQLVKMMAAETWLTAQDAVAAGLADGILGEETPSSGIFPAAVVNSVRGGMRALASTGGMPEPERLLAMYERMVADGKAPARPEDAQLPPAFQNDWRASARLSIAKARLR